MATKAAGAAWTGLAETVAAAERPMVGATGEGTAEKWEAVEGVRAATEATVETAQTSR